MAFRELKKEKIALAGGKIEKFVVDDHTVEVWVPKKVLFYTPVLMMHDGKDVFNPKTATDGSTWRILDALREDRIKGDLQPLIVAVHGLSKPTRMLELTPQEKILAEQRKNKNAKFLKENLKSINVLSETRNQYLAAESFLNKYKRFKVMGKSNLGNIILKLNERTVKINKKGDII
jgi:hypothetical protein